MPERRSPKAVDPLGDAKDAAERRLARKLGRALAAQSGRLSEYTPEELSHLPQEFWDKEAEQLLAFLSPDLQAMAEEAALATINGFPVGVDWTMINQEALNWAHTYSFDLVRKLNESSRLVLVNALETFVSTPGFTVGDIIERIAPSFGPVRAEMIAVTEVTRAYAQGQILASEQARAVGLNVQEVWQTNRDGLVCPICGPNQGKPRSEGWTVGDAPAHPRCRCWYTQEWTVEE